MKLFTRRTAAVAEIWICPSCSQTLASAFCPACGECPLHPHDLTLRGFVTQVSQAVVNIDGPILRSFRSLVTRPGALTLAYLQGQRRLYTLPLQLFLVANILFFAMQSLAGAKIFSTPLDQHLGSDMWGGIAQSLVMHHLDAKHITLPQYTPIFNQAVALNAKSLIVLMVLPFALLPAMVFYGSGRPFVAHVVYSLHFYAFLLLLLSVSLVVVAGDRLIGGRGLASESFDHALSIIEVAVCALYLYLASGTVYGVTGLSRILKTGLLAFAVVGIFLGYRFVLLIITLYST